MRFVGLRVLPRADFATLLLPARALDPRLAGRLFLAVFAFVFFAFGFGFGLGLGFGLAFVFGLAGAFILDLACFRDAAAAAAGSLRKS
jgi:hypothetical protein